MKRLKKIRELRNMSVKELSSILNTSTSTIYTWESTDTFPQVSELNKLSKLLRVTVDYLVENADSNLYCDETVVSRVFVAAQVKINQIVVQSTSQVVSLTMPLVAMDDDLILDILKGKIKERLQIDESELYEIDITSLIELTPVTMSPYAFSQMQLPFA